MTATVTAPAAGTNGHGPAPSGPGGSMRPAGPTVATGFHNLSPTQLRLTVAGLLLAMFVSALDQMVVGPAMPRIIAELNGFERYAWVTTAYMLTSTLGVPVFGKLSDIYGRKYFYIAGVLLFLVGSWLCGTAQDMNQLIGFRAFQ